MMEPEFLTPEILRGLEIEEELRSGNVPLPPVFLDIDLSTLVETPSINIPAILRLDGHELKSGLELHPLLTPGPADVAFVLAQKQGRLSTALYELGHYEHPTVVLILRGSMRSDVIFEYKGMRFARHGSVDQMHLEIIPAACQRDIFVERGSILLLGTPGRSGEIINLDVDDYLEPFRLVKMRRDIRALIEGRDLEGNRVSIHRHSCPERIRANSGGMMSFAIHASGEPVISTAPDMFVLGPGVEAETLLTRHTLDVEFV